MKRLIVALCVVLWPVVADAAGPVTGLTATARIASIATTTIVAGVGGQSIYLLNGSLCVDANGVTTSVLLQDSANTNLLGTGLVYVLAAGQCLTLPSRPSQQAYGVGTGVGNGLQVVTAIGAGPVEVYLEVLQR